MYILYSAIPTLHTKLQSTQTKTLNVTSRGPTKLAPGVPPVSAAVPGYEMDGWYGIIAPAGTPHHIVAKLNSTFTQVLSQPDIQERLFGVGAEALSSTPAEFGVFLQSEMQRWGKVIRDAGLKPQ